MGVVGLNLQRSDFYEKELTFQVSCSYRPGRYDDVYEQKGQDYPPGFVRWTEQRNFKAVLDAMASGRVDVSSLITDRIPFEEAEKAYAKISSDASTLGVVLEYSGQPEAERTIVVHQASSRPESACVAAMIGAGNFAKITMGPTLARTTARLKYVSARTKSAAARHIAEKPLCLIREELDAIVATYNKCSAASPRSLMVGFNRRFSPHIRKIRELLAGRGEPLAMNFTCNAGIIAPDAWVHDPEVGGGRIIGEACHFIDLLSCIAQSPVVSVAAFEMEKGVAVKEDKMAIALRFEDGSVGTVNYFGNGSKQYPKETLEIFSDGRVLRMNNFRKTEDTGSRNSRASRQGPRIRGTECSSTLLWTG